MLSSARQGLQLLLHTLIDIAITVGATALMLSDGAPDHEALFFAAFGAALLASGWHGGARSMVIFVVVFIAWNRWCNPAVSNPNPQGGSGIDNIPENWLDIVFLPVGCFLVLGGHVARTHPRDRFGASPQASAPPD